MSTVSFFEGDFSSSLFPLRTNQILMQHATAELAEYVARIISDAPEDASYSFLPQTRVYAAKPRNHLRRTLLLDPVATFFIYDLIYRNRSAFKAPADPARRSFGYYFDGDIPVAVHKAYREFQSEAAVAEFGHIHCLGFDVASYFNSIYHHDAANWFPALNGISGADAMAFGRFLREINAGRSIDFLPQGIYPTKVIGNAFLSYIENSAELKSSVLLRFMDDFYLFDDNLEVLIQDFYRIQQLLGLKALNVNPTKTTIDKGVSKVHEEASALKRELSELGDDSRSIYVGSGAAGDFDDDEGYEDSEEGDLEAAVVEADDSDEDRIERLQALLIDSRADESDVELILSILRGYEVDLATYIPGLLAKFPNIVKQLHALCETVSDRERLALELLSLVEGHGALTEYQLFWIAVIAEDTLEGTPSYGKLLLSLHSKTANYKVARAKLLEIPEQGYGLKEIREELLKTGASDWISWAAAMGTRTLNKAERNYALKYFSKGSLINHLISNCVQQLP